MYGRLCERDNSVQWGLQQLAKRRIWENCLDCGVSQSGEIIWRIPCLFMARGSFDGLNAAEERSAGCPSRDRNRGTCLSGDLGSPLATGLAGCQNHIFDGTVAHAERRLHPLTYPTTGLKRIRSLDTQPPTVQQEGMLGDFAALGGPSFSTAILQDQHFPP
jgi:hypothetical protein